MQNRQILANVVASYGESLHVLADNFSNMGQAIAQWDGGQAIARPSGGGLRGANPQLTTTTARRRVSRSRSRSQRTTGALASR